MVIITGLPFSGSTKREFLWPFISQSVGGANTGMSEIEFSIINLTFEGNFIEMVILWVGTSWSFSTFWSNFIVYTGGGVYAGGGVAFSVSFSLIEANFASNAGSDGP